MDSVENLLAQIADLQRDKQWIASELHDGLLQSIVAAHMAAQSLKRKWPVTSGPIPVELDNLLRILQQAMTEGRRLIDVGDAESLLSDDLERAIRSLIETSTLRDDTQFTVDLAIRGHLRPEIQQALYRVVQEGVSNICQHSGAMLARVELEATDGDIRLTISDNGRGFDPQAISAGHLGLENMRRRIEQLNGVFDIQTAPGRGTTLTATIPR